jgi:hypothetical protein
MWISHATSLSRLLWNRTLRWQETPQNNTSEEYSSTTDVFFTFVVERRYTNLWVAPYSQYQTLLHGLICDFRKKGWNYQQIADWLNQNDLTTPRGHKFLNAHAISIVKKKHLRDARLTKRYPPKFSDFAISFVDKTLINSNPR